MFGLLFLGLMLWIGAYFFFLPYMHLLFQKRYERLTNEEANKMKFYGSMTAGLFIFGFLLMLPLFFGP